jgi:hypothetical protein
MSKNGSRSMSIFSKKDDPIPTQPVVIDLPVGSMHERSGQYDYRTHPG